MNAILDWAEEHHGVVTRQEAWALDVSKAEFDAVVRSGLLERLGPNTYRVRGSVPTPKQKLLAAVRVAGPDALAAGYAALWLWRIQGFSLSIETRRPGGRSVDGAVGRLHQTLYLPPHHRSEVDGIPVTSPARTAFDACGFLHPDRAVRMLHDFDLRRLVRTPQLRVVLAETGRRGRAGTATLRAILGGRDDSYQPTASELEDLVEAVHRAYGLPQPRRQVSVGDAETPVGCVDFRMPSPAQNIIIEANSKRWHDSFLRQIGDDRRDARLRKAGLICVRTNWWQLTYEPWEYVLNGTIALLTG
ncbi:MAG: type IV toxin-antitoxin system AbiEi family antitoxin domain-containing protein [Actinobacteria bacterium]|nr:type IV toxin-antitoxin system AbiEi family antitoxin domain-containing protein [Actinomycetota bacterium]